MKGLRVFCLCVLFLTREGSSESAKNRIARVLMRKDFGCEGFDGWKSVFALLGPNTLLLEGISWGPLSPMKASVSIICSLRVLVPKRHSSSSTERMRASGNDEGVYE